jgi:hypothetical protein
MGHWDRALEGAEVVLDANKRHIRCQFHQLFCTKVFCIVLSIYLGLQFFGKRKFAQKLLITFWWNWQQSYFCQGNLYPRDPQKLERLKILVSFFFISNKQLCFRGSWYIKRKGRGTFQSMRIWTCSSPFSSRFGEFKLS